MAFSIFVKTDIAAIKAKVEADKKKALPIITNEFIKDANFYCKEDSGELQRSAIKASRPEKGEAIWQTPYAKRQYYTGIPSTDRNPNASTLWAHKADAEHRAKYQKMLQKIIEGKG